jgi:predicted DNA-binding transcriptional regulator YafY
MAREKFSKFRSRLWKVVAIDRQLREQFRRGRPCTKQSLLDEISGNERTLRRLIELMRIDLDAPIEFDRALKSYKYTHPNWICPNVHLDEDELQALATAVQAIQPVTPAPFAERLDQLLAKLLDALPEARRAEIRRTQEQIEIIPAPVRSKGAQWVAPLLKAMRDELSVDMTYHAMSKDCESERRFDPYHLRYDKGAWYAIGYDHLTRHFPVFHLARIRKLTVSEDIFTKRPFDAKTYFKDSFGIIVGGKAQTVRIKLTGWTARTAGEKIWPAGFSYQATSEDEGILTGRVGDFTELGAWVAACQGDAKILPRS